jgi:hypothetical protein
MAGRERMGGNPLLGSAIGIPAWFLVAISTGVKGCKTMDIFC